MQWNDSTNAGFSTAKSTWLPVTPSYKKYNAAVESNDRNSILNFYKELIKLRRSNDALINGSYTAVDESNKDVLSYLRRSENESVLVALNMTPETKTVHYDLTTYGINTNSAHALLSSPHSSSSSASLKNLTLPPFGVFIGKVQ
jgi:glycosidase